MLKVECLPYDVLDFSKILDTLWKYGFIQKYKYQGHLYGFIPSFLSHQVINIREAKSALPDPLEGEMIENTCMHMHAHALPVHAQGEGKGKEGKGREKEKEGNHENTFSFTPEIKDLVIEEKDLIINTEPLKKTEVARIKCLNIYRAFKHLKLTLEEFEKLREQYTKEEIDFTLDKIENYKLNKNYTSLYLTANNWLKSDLEKKSNTVNNGIKTATEERMQRTSDLAELSRATKSFLTNVDL